MYFDDIWIAFLNERIVRQAVRLSEIKCPGCQSNLKSPLLHLHHQHSLLDKLTLYFDEIRGSILPTVPELYDQIKERLPHSDDPSKDKDCYVNIGRQFLITLSCEALYWGRYQNEMIDGFVDEGFQIKKKARANPKKRSRVTPV